MKNMLLHTILYLNRIPDNVCNRRARLWLKAYLLVNINQIDKKSKTS